MSQNASGMRVAALPNQEKLISTTGSASGSVNSRYIFCGHATAPDFSFSGSSILSWARILWPLASLECRQSVRTGNQVRLSAPNRSILGLPRSVSAHCRVDRQIVGNEAVEIDFRQRLIGKQSQRLLGAKPNRGRSSCCASRQIAPVCGSSAILKCFVVDRIGGLMLPQCRRFPARRDQARVCARWPRRAAARAAWRPHPADPAAFRPN